MEVYTLPLGSYMTNCYLVSGKPGACVVIDPGFEPERILAFLEKKGLTPEAILLTHGHFDHVGAVLSIREKYGCPVYLAPEDLKLPAFSQTVVPSIEWRSHNGPSFYNTELAYRSRQNLFGDIYLHNCFTSAIRTSKSADRFAHRLPNGSLTSPCACREVCLVWAARL